MYYTVLSNCATICLESGANNAAELYKKRIISFLLVFTILVSVTLCTASATLGHTYKEKNYVFCVGDTIGFAPFGAVVRYYIAVNYTRDSTARTTLAAASLETACTYWAGKGIASLTPMAGICVKYYADSTDTLLRTQQLQNGVSFYKVTSSSWYAIACSGTSTKTSMGYSRIRAEGGGSALVQDALIPAYTYTSEFSF